MNDCNLKTLLIIICIIIILIGLYLAVTREKKNIEKGTKEDQNAKGNIKEGSFNIKFTIGLFLIIIGLIGAFYCAKDLGGCDTQQDFQVTNIINDEKRKQDSLANVIAMVKSTIDSINKKIKLDSADKVYKMQKVIIPQELDSIKAKASKDLIELQKGLEEAKARYRADSIDQAKADLSAHTGIKKILGNWRFTWHSTVLNHTLEGNMSITEDFKRGPNFVWGHIKTDKTVDGLYINHDFSGTYQDNRLSICWKTTCFKTNQCYNLIYNYSSDSMSGSFTNEGTNKKCFDAGTFVIKRNL